MPTLLSLCYAWAQNLCFIGKCECVLESFERVWYLFIAEISHATLSLSIFLLYHISLSVSLSHMFSSYLYHISLSIYLSFVSHIFSCFSLTHVSSYLYHICISIYISLSLCITYLYLFLTLSHTFSICITFLYLFISFSLYHISVSLLHIFSLSLTHILFLFASHL